MKEGKEARPNSLDKLNKKWESSIGYNAHSWSNKDITELILDLAFSLSKDLKGIKYKLKKCKLKKCKLKKCKLKKCKLKKCKLKELK